MRIRWVAGGLSAVSVLAGWWIGWSLFDWPSAVGFVLALATGGLVGVNPGRLIMERRMGTAQVRRRIRREFGDAQQPAGRPVSSPQP